MTATPTSSWLEEYERIQPHLPGNDTQWLQTLRRDSLAHLKETGFPTTRDERWRYTNVRALLKNSPHSTIGESASDSAAVQYAGAIDGLDALRFVFINGELAIQPSSLPQGVTVRQLNQVLSDSPDQLDGRIGAHGADGTHGFLFANQAFLSQGVVIDVAAGVSVEQPIELTYVATGDVAVVNQPRNLVSIGEQSRVLLVERYTGAAQEQGHLTNTVTEVTVGASANLEHIRLQQDAATNSHIGGLFVGVERDATYVSHNINMGARLARVELVMRLLAPGAVGTLNGLYLGADRQHIDNYTHIEHLKPHGTSREYYNGVMNDRSRAVFHGRVVVAKDAQQTDAAQSNRNLLLSPYAEADTKPQLEIYADDVKCAHGATVGQLDETSLFYLRTRGIKENEARNLLVFAFADDVVERIEHEALRRYTQRLLASRLPGGDAFVLPD